MLLTVKDLSVKFTSGKRAFEAVRGVSFGLEQGKTLCLVGESGSGKSVTATAILRLLDEKHAEQTGKILFESEEGEVDLGALPLKKMQKIRGNQISMIFQEPMTALNPVLSIKKQLSEPFVIHRNCSKKQAEKEALKALQSVRILGAERVLKGYPHQLSGGMRQRVMIAMALACEPKILIADEPTTALDVTVQAQILRLMKHLQAQKNTAILLITHDLGVVNENADTVAVMYCGQVVELAPRNTVFCGGKYSHPYTEGLLAATPKPKSKGVLPTIEGSVPLPWELPKGCKFAPRCKYKTEKCLQSEPPLFSVGEKQAVRCFYANKEERKGGEHARFIVR